jgi:hypothetical protein
MASFHNCRHALAGSKSQLMFPFAIRNCQDSPLLSALDHWRL